MAIKVNTSALTGDADDCDKGHPCGLACISQNKICLKNLSPEQVEIVMRMRELILANRRGVNPDGTGKRELDKAFGNLVNNLNKRANNLNEAQEMEKVSCGANGNKQACEKAKTARKLAEQHLKDTETALAALRLNLERETRSKFKQAADLMLPDGYIDNMKKNHNNNVALQKEVNDAAIDYQDRWERIQNDYADVAERAKAERALFKEYDDKLTDIYRRTGKKPLNEMYLDNDFMEAAYDILPNALKKYLKDAGAIGENLGVAQLEHGEDDFDENGFYTGGQGKVVNQRREGTYTDNNGQIRTTDEAEANGRERGKALLEIYLRGEGNNIWADTPVNIAKMEAEHLTDWKNNKRHTDNWGNLGAMERAGNGWKGSQSMEEWAEGSNGYKNTTTEERNQAAKQRAGKRAGRDAKAGALFDDTGKPKFTETIVNTADTNDKMVKKATNAYNKGKPKNEQIDANTMREKIRNQDDPKANILAAKSYLENADTARKVFVADPTVENPRYNRPMGGDGREGTMAYKTQGMTLTASLTVGGENITLNNGKTLSEVAKSAYERTIAQAKEAEKITKEMKKNKGVDYKKAQLERERKPYERYDNRFKVELEKELQGTEYSVDDVMDMAGIKI